VQWTLRTRLEAAERERRLAAGLSPEDPEVNPPPPSDTIDLRDTRQAALAHAVGAPVPAARVSSELPSRTRPTLRELAPARPVRSTLTSSLRSAGSDQPATDPRVVTTPQPTKDRCPQCQGTVRLIRFDLDRAVAEMHCLDCGLQYTAKSPRL
jgi:hypothetical protein